MEKTSPPELIRLLFGHQANSMTSLVSDRLTRWAEAFDIWLDERERSSNRSIRSISHCAWRDLLTFKKKAPWEMQEADVLEWVDALVDRGLRPSTINQRLTALTKFYLYCQEKGVDGGHVPDPAAHIPRLQERKYSKSLYLGEAELQALLAAIDHQSSIIGQRDYAIILALLSTGLKPKEVRELRWGDLVRGDRVRIRTPRGLGVTLPPAMWQATVTYLLSSGRLAGMQAEDYIFTALADPLLKAPSGDPQEWKRDQPISAALLKFVLKRYAAGGGLRVEDVTCYTLRHTAAVLRLQAGDETEAVQAFFGRVSLIKTREYLDRLAGQPRPDLWDPDAEPAEIQRGPMRAEPGNLMAFQHGFYATHLPGEDPATTRDRSLESEIEKMRYVMERVFEQSVTGVSQVDPLQLLEVYGKAVTRLANLMRIQQSLQDEHSELEEIISQAVSEVSQEMDLKL